MWHACKKFYDTIQKEDEDLKIFYDCFRNQVVVIKNCGGIIGHDKSLYKDNAMLKKIERRRAARKLKHQGS